MYLGPDQNGTIITPLLRMRELFSHRSMAFRGTSAGPRMLEVHSSFPLLLRKIYLKRIVQQVWSSSLASLENDFRGQFECRVTSNIEVQVGIYDLQN